VTGTFGVYGHEVLLSAAGLDSQSIIYFARHYGRPRNVLGGVGFLDRILLGLDDYTGRLALSRRNGQ